MAGYCAGEGFRVDPPWGPVSTTKVATRCSVFADKMPSVTDIRQQINTTASRFMTGSCGSSVPGDDFDACLDWVSYELEVAPENAYLFWVMSHTYTGKRVWQREARVPGKAYGYPLMIARPVSEVIAKPERLQTVIFRLPKNVTETKATILVGGRKKSEGKYIIQAYVTDFEEY
jgi:hypothetical protein